jgi:DeoR family transcriptional regulator, aga operon transcriptional repressor
MRTGQRRREILRRLFLSGYVEAKELATSLGVDSSTIRRDLDALASAGRLQRTHGGARALAGAVDIPYSVKQRERIAAKEAIAAVASRLVRDGDSVLLDSGSTTHQLAVALRRRRDLTIVTNDVLIGQRVADYAGVRLLMTGGELLTSTYTLFGDRAVAFIAQLRVDWTFLGADAIDPDNGITNTNTLEIPLKRAMLSAGRTAVVVADSSKFGRQALVRVAALDEVDRVLTDDDLPEEEAQRYGDRVQRCPMVAPDEADVPDVEVATVGDAR